MQPRTTEDFYTRERIRHAGFAAVVFVFSAVLVHLTRGGLSSLFTLDALLFMLVGTPLSALVLGSFAFHLHKGVAALLFRRPPADPGPATLWLVKALDVLLKVVVVLVGWYLVLQAWLGLHQG